ncbi:hypothetical protein FJ941_21390 [Mesorhizobium sp. B2-3-13]|uniref:hypothetical protein n=1 Tax=Mesorhizobium sp. B2-3-13 TaxID=2589951 RepID=UPI00112EB6F7|nr:hypothetical protein [Mesorhizobium sp. B2-3-13]TPL78850.1 hypothetical protein FJ941_21390 [Mesorhizobium sp. B2-3-13]
MVKVINLGTEENAPAERHVVVVVHQETLNDRVREKAYFYDSARGDYGGSGPFNFLLDEAMRRAQRFASDNTIAKIVVRAQHP